MPDPFPQLSRDLDAVSAACGAGASDSSASDSSDDAMLAIPAMPDGDLLALVDAAAQLVRDAQGILTRAAAEVAKRSPAELGHDGLAKKRGFLNAAHLIATSAGGRASDAARLIAVGVDTAPRQSLSGEPLPPMRPHVAAALADGRISIDAAAAITGMLKRVAPRADTNDADRMEEILAERARELPLDLLMRVIREAEARLDQDGIEPREEELRADRSLIIRQDSRGMVRLTARLDPESAAPIKAAIEAIVTHEIRAARTDGDAGRSNIGTRGPDGDGSVIGETRSIPRMQADALAMIARHVLGCDRVPAAAATTVVVRMDLDRLVEGLGHGRIDGLDHPVSVGTIRRMAASAGIIPAVLGTDSLPLDLGRTARCFSPAQRIALAERDGGCASCGLAVAYTEAHHIRWWMRDTGPTDLDNGVLLCPPCHTRIHQDGWEIDVREGRVWFTPPPQVDASRTPRLGGRARFESPESLAVA